MIDKLVLAAAVRVSQVSAHARAIINELDGPARGVHLLGRAIGFRTRADLARVAFEVQSVLHPGSGNYLYALYGTQLPVVDYP